VTALDFGARLAAVVEREGLRLTDLEVTNIVARYGHCPGHEPWSVRTYARAWASQGAREYRVMRGNSVQDVYVSALRDSASTVGAALNELESTNAWVDFQARPKENSR
jgi:hypothetical protein